MNNSYQAIGSSTTERARQRPQPPQRRYLIPLRFAQDVAHPGVGSESDRLLNVRAALLLLAGFQTSLIGRFWTSPEVAGVSIGRPLSRPRAGASSPPASSARGASRSPASVQATAAVPCRRRHLLNCGRPGGDVLPRVRIRGAGNGGAFGVAFGSPGMRCHPSSRAVAFSSRPREGGHGRRDAGSPGSSPSPGLLSASNRRGARDGVTGGCLVRRGAGSGRRESSAA